MARRDASKLQLYNLPLLCIADRFRVNKVRNPEGSFLNWKKRNICGQRLKPSQSLWPRGFHAQLAYQQHTNSRLALTHSRIHVPLLQTLQVRRQRRRRKLIRAHLHQVKYIYVTRQSNQMHVQPWFFFFFFRWQWSVQSPIHIEDHGHQTAGCFSYSRPNFYPPFMALGRQKVSVKWNVIRCLRLLCQGSNVKTVRRKH